MMKNQQQNKHVITVDLGGSSGSLIYAEMIDNKMSMEEIYRFPNIGISAENPWYQ